MSTSVVRLFPLPNLVLFPHVVQGLHIFEPRYRQMTADALAGDRLLALVKLADVFHPDDEVPAIEEVACVGEIVGHEQLPDGRYNLRLRGTGRVRVVEEVTTDRLYRTARVELLPDVAPSDLAQLAGLRRDLAAAVYPHFPDGSPARQQLQELFDGDRPLGHVCDVLAYALPLPTDLKQSLLAEPRVARRATVIEYALRTSAARAARPFPPPFSAN
ncbi:MAG: peptidase S16 [Planctomycetes bacterium]|nr:peptidase S16 [Planctomycetota bacterium]